MNAEWTHFRKRISIDASPQKVYEAWTTRAGLERWFLRQAKITAPDGTERKDNDTIKAGDHYHWLWFGYPDEMSEKRLVSSVNGKDYLQFEFTGDCFVSVTIKAVEGVTICELVQENIPLDENPKTNLYIGCGEGWTFYMANLKSILEGGIDLRNKNVKLTGVINS